MGRDKFNIVEELAEKDQELTGSIAMLGASALTQTPHINAMRSTMFSAHLKQLVVLDKPEYPLYSTSAENTVGKFSSGYKKTKHTMRVFRKVMKYSDILEKPYFGLVFMIDEKRKTIRVEERKEVENLTEVYGFKYNNEEIDSLEEGDVVDKGTVLYKSTSYDEYMNYGYGKNVRFMYSMDASTTEDAAVVSESLAKSMTSSEIKTIKIPVNDNHFLLNLYGTDYDYRPLPGLGQKIKQGVITAKRTLITNQILNDFKSNSLSKINYASDELYHGDGIVIDIDVFCNNEDLKRNSFNSQIVDIFESEKKYYQEILDICEEIYRMRDEEGYEVNKKINFWYSKARTFLREDYKWKEGEGVFSNIILQITTLSTVPIHIGQKITGRAGNKSVVAEIRPDYLMPTREDGVRIDLLMPELSNYNRGIVATMYENVITFMCERACQHAKTLSSLGAQKEFLFDIIRTLNPEQADLEQRKYDEMSKTEKKEYIESIINEGIYIYTKPFADGDVPLFFRVREAFNKYEDIMKPYRMFIYKFGRWIECMNPLYSGVQYIMKLKQTSKKGFIARNTGEINMEGLPVKSRAHKTGRSEMSENTVRFGEFETYEFKVVMPSQDLAKFFALYRSSVKGRRDLAASLLQDEGTFEFDKSYNSRVNEIFAVYLKSLGVEINFKDECSTINEYDDSKLKEFHLGKETLICTEWDFYKESMRAEIEDEVLAELGVVDDATFQEEVEKRFKIKMETTIG